MLLILPVLLLKVPLSLYLVRAARSIRTDGKYGRKDKYVAKLDSMFSEQRYWHGNEPCHQVAYMFNYAGEPWKTQSAVRHVMETEYLNEPGGLSGNDDAGQMSAWYMFAAMGFYPVCPGTPYYILASPHSPASR